MADKWAILQELPEELVSDPDIDMPAILAPIIESVVYRDTGRTVDVPPAEVAWHDVTDQVVSVKADQLAAQQMRLIRATWTEGD